MESLFLIIGFIVLPIFGIWYYLWDEKKKKSKKLEDEKLRVKEDREYFEESFTNARNQTTFESITPLPAIKFDEDEQIYFQTSNYNSIVSIKNAPCRGGMLFYTILTNHKLILFHNGGIDTFSFDELSYFVAYERIVIVLNRVFERIAIRNSSDELAKVEAALIKFGVPYFFEETKEVKPKPVERKMNFFSRFLRTA